MIETSTPKIAPITPIIAPNTPAIIPIQIPPSTIHKGNVINKIITNKTVLDEDELLRVAIDLRFESGLIYIGAKTIHNFKKVIFDIKTLISTILPITTVAIRTLLLHKNEHKVKNLFICS